MTDTASAYPAVSNQEIYMSRATVSLTLAVTALIGALSVPTQAATAAGSLTAADVVDRNIAARGGLSAWHAVQTLSWSGTLDAGGHVKQAAAGEPAKAGAAKTDAAKVGPRNAAQPSYGPGKMPAAPSETGTQAQLPFSLEMKRSRKTRLELEFKGQTAVQVYDGTQGWKVRPFLNRHEVESFTADELKAVASQADLDGYLVDYAAKDIKIELDGVEEVEGKDAYKLKLTLKNKQMLREWIDAKTFLEVKIEGTPRRLDNRVHPVFVSLRDYRSVNGLRFPHVLETSVQGVRTTERIRIEKVVVNPALNESRFAKPT
jgi:hypothetical protein